jgi:hypothetical protein
MALRYLDNREARLRADFQIMFRSWNTLSAVKGLMRCEKRLVKRDRVCVRAAALSK